MTEDGVDLAIYEPSNKKQIKILKGENDRFLYIGKNVSKKLQSTKYLLGIVDQASNKNKIMKIYDIEQIFKIKQILKSKLNLQQQ